MKQILLALTIIGTMHFSANAQVDSKFAQNYKVCMVGDKYKTCAPDDDAIQPSNKEAKKTEAALRRLDSYVRVRSTTTATSKKNPRFSAAYETPEEVAYLGMNSPINDGVTKNKVRNINYNNGVEVPPNDGGVSDKTDK